MKKKGIRLEGREEAVRWIEFDILRNEEGLFHASLLRNGGNSKGNFESLNLSYDVGDEKESVDENFNLVRNAFKLEKIVYCHQVHGIHVEYVTESSSEEIRECDALMTNVSGVAIMTRNADCQSAIFYDPVNKAIANAHAGWRGNAQNIYAVVIEAMKKKFHSKPEDLLVCISPSLGPEAAEFKNFDELPKYFLDFQVTPNHLDLWAIAKKQLIDSGILENHIEIAKICTFSNPKDFFSYRYNNTTGRQGTVIGLL